MYMRIHETPKGKIVAACDRELIGSVLDDKRSHLDLQAYEGFYKGSLSGADDLKNALRDFTSANLVGKRTVSVALDLGLAEGKSVMYINKTPHIQLYRL